VRSLSLLPSISSAVKIWLWARRSRVQFFIWATQFSLLKNIQTSPVTHLSRWLVGQGGRGRALFLGVKQPRCEVDHSPVPNAMVMDEGIYTSAPPICLNGIHRGLNFYLFYANIYSCYDVLNKEKLQGFYNLKMEYTLELLQTTFYIKSILLSMKRQRHINNIRNMICVTSFKSDTVFISEKVLGL
jgi:hypothetical protein